MEIEQPEPEQVCIEVIAHRAGNTVDQALQACRHADRIEMDVHILYGRVEVRHEKVIRPTRRLWERWYLLSREARGVDIADVFDAVGSSTPVMLDLKCFTRRAARRILSAIPVGQPVTVSARSWWVLASFRSRPSTIRLRSCGNRAQLRLAQLIPGLGDTVGVVAHERLLDDSDLAELRTRTSSVVSWGATTSSRCQELADAGITGLVLDDVSLFSSRC